MHYHNISLMKQQDRCEYCFLHTTYVSVNIVSYIYDILLQCQVETSLLSAHTLLKQCVLRDNKKGRSCERNVKRVVYGTSWLYKVFWVTFRVRYEWPNGHISMVQTGKSHTP